MDVIRPFRFMRTDMCMGNEMRLLFLDLDTLRPDHLGCYGYHRDTSPNIDFASKQGVLFTNYYCSDAPCLPSRTALMTGRFGIHTGVVGHGGTAADMRLEGSSRGFTDKLGSESLPALLRSSGIRTVTISPFAERHSSWNFYAGFNEVYNTGRRGMESAEDITPIAIDWIDRNAESDNWMLHINYWDAHTPYRVPTEFGNPFQNSPLNSWVTSDILEQHRSLVGPHTACELYMYSGETDPRYPRYPGQLYNMEDFKALIDGYDSSIRYMDEHIGCLFDALRAKDIFDDTAIIITADHGENMGELGIYGEHATADYGTCRIPMIIRWPGITTAHEDDGLHYNLDLLPTIAEILGKNLSGYQDGISYFRSLFGGDSGRDYLVLGQCAHVCQRSVRMDDWLYVRTYHDGYHLFNDEMLFDLSTDPHEQVDLALHYPEICMKSVYILNRWHDDMMKSMPYDVDPLWTVIKEGGPWHAKGFLADYCKRLEATGRGWAIPELKKRHPGEFLG